MRSLVITVLSSSWLRASLADCIVSKAADDVNLQSLGESVEADETSLLHTRLRVRPRERSADRLNVTLLTRLRSKRRQGPVLSDDGVDLGDDGPDLGPNGNPCVMCDPPAPGRGYTGIGIPTSLLPATPDLASLHAEGNYALRDDCGNSFLEAIEIPLSEYIYNTTTSTHNAYPGYTNAWCERGIQQVAADSFANRDPLYQGKTFVVPNPYDFDFFYCKDNGFLSLAARQAVAGGFETAQTYARSFCSGKAAQFGNGFIEGINLGFMFEAVAPSQSRDPVRMTKEEASHVGAWLCAMGGTDGLKGAQSDGSLPDMAYCQYTFGDLGDEQYCIYDECDGWDPVTGMPVTELMTRAA